MSDVYILQNQAALLLGKQKDWLDGRDPASLFKTPHKDEAINLMFETSSKDYTQRIHIVQCALNEKGIPIIPQEILPEAGSGAPAAKAGAPVAAEEEVPETIDAEDEAATIDLPDEDLEGEEDVDQQVPLL